MTDLDVNRPGDEFSEMLEGMTKQELIKYGNITYGLALTAQFNKADLVNSIKASASKFKLNEGMKVGEHLRQEEVAPGFAEIQLHRSELSKGKKSVIVGLNGRFASLPMGTTFWCPLELLNILKDAVRIEYEQDMSVSPPELVPRNVHSYPFTVLRISPHTPESMRKAEQKRGMRGRAPGAARQRRQARLDGRLDARA